MCDLIGLHLVVHGREYHQVVGTKLALVLCASLAFALGTCMVAFEFAASLLEESLDVDGHQLRVDLVQTQSTKVLDIKLSQLSSRDQLVIHEVGSQHLEDNL